MNQALLDAAKRYFIMSKKAGVPQKPKAHLLMHLPLRAMREGNPSLAATWQDETLNRHAAAISAVAHRSVWGLRVLTFFEQMVSSRDPPLKRKR